MAEALTPFNERAVCSETLGNGEFGGTTFSSVAT